MKLELYLCVWSVLLICDFIVCPPVTEKPEETTTLSEKEQEDLVNQTCFLVIILCNSLLIFNEFELTANVRDLYQGRMIFDKN